MTSDGLPPGLPAGIELAGHSEWRLHRPEPLVSKVQNASRSFRPAETCRRQQQTGSGQLPGMTSSDQAELVAARKRIAELEAQLEIHRKATELLSEAIMVIATAPGWQIAENGGL